MFLVTAATSPYSVDKAACAVRTVVATHMDCMLGDEVSIGVYDREVFHATQHTELVLHDWNRRQDLLVCEGG